jgi:septal ring factor EnvC (AmiA/AmiB activator)
LPSRPTLYRIGPAACGLLLLGALAAGQNPEPDPSRLEERIRVLQGEAARLAKEARTMLNELRALEVERDLRRAEAAQARTAVEEAQSMLAGTQERLQTLEQQRTAQLPAIRAQLVDLYKQGDLGYVRILLGAGTVRELGRASRMVATLADSSRRRLETHRRTIDEVRQERELLEERSDLLQARQAEADRTRASAERAVATLAGRLAAIDARRDLTAQYVGELQVARQGLIRQSSAAPDEPAAIVVPLAPFRGALRWPADGRLTGRFGQTANRLGGSAVRNGIEVAAPEGAPVRAIHDGLVARAEGFPGLGTLVIVDHGADAYSLYGYLNTTAVTAGQRVEGGAELGTVGVSPAGPAALYFELRIDGRAVDPVQWLEPR